MRVEHKTCGSMCGKPVQPILDQKNLTRLAGGVREVQNMAQNGLRLHIFLASDPSRGLSMGQGPLKLTPKLPLIDLSQKDRKTERQKKQKDRKATSN